MNINKCDYNIRGTTVVNAL